MGLYYSDHLTRDAVQAPLRTLPLCDGDTHTVTLAKADALYCKRAVAIRRTCPWAMQSSHPDDVDHHHGRQARARATLPASAPPLGLRGPAHPPIPSGGGAPGCTRLNEGRRQGRSGPHAPRPLALALGSAIAEALQGQTRELRPTHLLSISLPFWSRARRAQSIRRCVLLLPTRCMRVLGHAALRCMSLRACVTYLRCSYVRCSR
jgi:hypothetical protein